MTEPQAAFLQLLGEYLFGMPKHPISIDTAQAVLRLSVPQNILGLCVSAFQNHPELSLSASYRKPVVAQTVLQIRKTERFLSFYHKLVSSGLTPVCVKGITVRELYPEPDLRPSSDEDLIIDSAELSLLSELAVQEGFELVTRNEQQVTAFDKETGLMIEAQTCFFLSDDRISQRMNGFFDNARSRLTRNEHQGVGVFEPGYTDHLLYLFCHVLKHYIRSGFGIRQICDILVFSVTYADRIDFDYVFDRLVEISAEGFAADIFRIGKEFFGLEKLVPKAALGKDVDYARLLEDVFSAGVFGKSTAARTHSAPLTLAAVRGSESVGKSAAKRAFISLEELKERYPKLEKRRHLYLYYSLRRLASYFAGSKSVSTTRESVAIASDRIGQLKRYGLLGEREKREYDEAVVSVLRERLRHGLTAELTVTGSSMTPFLVPERDSVELSEIRKEPETGDVFFYRRDNGTYVLHRIVKRKKDGFYFAGDSQTFIEGPVGAGQLLGVCVSFTRKGKRITGNEVRWRLYRFWWCRLIRLRPVLLKLYEKMKK